VETHDDSSAKSASEVVDEYREGQNKHQEEHKARIEAIKKNQGELDKIKDELSTLCRVPHVRSQDHCMLLQDNINRLFQASDIVLKKPFDLINIEGGTPENEINGVVEIDDLSYLTEIIWQKEPLGKTEISPYLVNIFNSSHAGGILIASGYTETAINICSEALSKKIIVLCEFGEILFFLENKGNLADLFKSKIKMAVIENQPSFHPAGFIRPTADQHSEPPVSEEKQIEVQKFLDKVVAYEKHKKRIEHDNISDHDEIKRAPHSQHPPLTLKKAYLDSIQEERMFVHRGKNTERQPSEYDTIEEKNDHRVTSPGNKPQLTLKKSQQTLLQDEQLPADRQNKHKPDFAKRKKATGNNEKKDGTPPPASRKKQDKGPSKEEQQLVGQEEILDRYVTELKKRSRGRGVMKLRRLLDLQRAYPNKAFLAAVSQASKYGLYDLARLEKIILDNIAGGEFFDLS